MLTLMLVVALHGTEAVDVDSAAFHARLDQAVVRGSLPALDAARTELLGAIADRPTPQRSYTLAYTDWRMVSILPASRKDDRMKMLREAEEALRSSIAAKPDDAEAHALMASVLGRMIGFQPGLGASLGPRAAEAHRTAQRLDGGRSPRLPLLRGIRAFVVPAEFGGSIEQAEAELRTAERLFAEEPPGAPWPNWGRLDTLAWLGQVRARRGDVDGARALYRRALDMAPDYAFVQKGLLPALDRPAGAR
jgi:tetratricopeptide (TPR) repeat protein